MVIINGNVIDVVVPSAFLIQIYFYYKFCLSKRFEKKQILDQKEIISWWKLVKMLLMISKNLFCISFRNEDCSVILTDCVLSKNGNTNKKYRWISSICSQLANKNTKRHGNFCM